MNIKNILLIIAVLAFLSTAIIFLFDMSNVERQRQANQNVNQSQLGPGLPVPPRPESQIITVPLSGMLFMVGIIVLVFYIAFSFYEQNFQREISVISTIANPKKQHLSDPQSGTVENTIMNLLSQNERRVVKILIENHGVCLQSDISRMNNMGKVKAHRYVQSLLKMGIVSIERYGNTNRVSISENVKKLLSN